MFGRLPAEALFDEVLGILGDDERVRIVLAEEAFGNKGMDRLDERVPKAS
jgi:hypothetical protein